MKRWMFIAGMAVLAGCSQAEDSQPAPEATETTAPEPVAAMAADGMAAPGTYRVTTQDGSVFTEEVKPDGTYVQSDADGKVVETGTWEQKSPEEYCYTVDAAYREEGAPTGQQCNSETIGEDGVWTSTNPQGETATVERVEA